MHSTVHETKLLPRIRFNGRYFYRKMSELKTPGGRRSIGEPAGEDTEQATEWSASVISFLPSFLLSPPLYCPLVNGKNEQGVFLDDSEREKEREKERERRRERERERERYHWWEGHKVRRGTDIGLSLSLSPSLSLRCDNLRDSRADFFGWIIVFAIGERMRSRDGSINRILKKVSRFVLGTGDH